MQPTTSVPDYKNLFESLPGLFLALSPDLIILAASNKFLQTTGFKPGELIGQPMVRVCERLAPEALEGCIQEWQHSRDYLLRHKTIHQMEVQRYQESNLETEGNTTAQYWQPTNTPVFNMAGELAYIIHEARDITQEYLFKQEAQQNKERVDLVALATNDAIWDWDLQNNTINWNESYKTLFGYESNNHTISTWDESIHPEDRERVVSGINAVIKARGKFWSDEYRYRCADGSYSVIMDRGYVLYDERKQPYRMVGSMQDITLQKKAEKQVTDSADFFQFLANSVQAFVWTTNPEGKTDYLNKYFLDFVGLDRRTNFHFFDILPPDQQQTFQEQWVQYLKSGRAFEMEVLIKHKDGNARWVLARATPYYDENGNLLKWLGTATDIHTHKQALLELEESNKRFRFLADTVPAFIWTSTPDGITDYRNLHYYEYLGYKPDNDSEFNRHDPIHPDDQPKTNEAWSHSVKTGEPFTEELRVKAKDGTYRWFLSRARPMRNSQGNITKWFGTSIDIEEQKIKQQVLQEHDAYLQRLLNDAPLNCTVLKGPDLVYTFMNTSMSKLFNRNLIGLRYRDAWPELKDSPLEDLLLSVYKTGKSVFLNEQPVYLDKKNDGHFETGYYNLTYLPLLDQENNIEGVLSYSIEVTERVLDRHRLETLAQNLREETNKFKFLSEAVPQLIWTTDPQGYHDYFNLRWIEYTGYSLDDSLGTEMWSNLLHPDDQERARAVWSHSLQTGEDYHIEYRFKRASDGEWRWFLGLAKPMRDKAGQIIKWFGSCTDVHEQKLVQQQLQETNDELKKINEDLDRFVYTASHDLKHPIINMEGIFVELMRNTISSDPDHDKLVQMFHKSLTQIHTTITDLSEIAKVQKNLNAGAEEIALSRLTEEVLLSIQDIIQSSRAQIIMDFAAAPKLNFSRLNLRSILYNLISNAIKYAAPERPPVINISTAYDQEYVVLSVQDNGLGINLNRHREKVFQMFKRFHNHVPGTGLGLYIINRIMQNNKGFIEVESQVNVGSTFRVYFKQV